MIQERIDETQMHGSIASSLKNSDIDTINVDPWPFCIDNMTLHSPCPKVEDILTDWNVFEGYVLHQITTLGISNMNFSTLRTLYDAAKVNLLLYRIALHQKLGMISQYAVAAKNMVSYINHRV